MFDFSPKPTLTDADKRAYELAEMRDRRDDLAQRMMLSATGKAELEELNHILDA